MAQQATLDPTQNNLTWSITIGGLKVAVYRAVLVSNTNVVLEVWNDQRTDDSVPDVFPIVTPSPALVGGVLWWQAIVMDPTDAGGTYTGTVTVLQHGVPIATVTATKTVPAGAGASDLFTDEIKF
jgi:hypothetical protein